ncbi:MAG: T9SS C-terminal target domain-containing protein [Balneolaceae bacterium]|nr:MAG: T9SS C-terminal target domain-containing protein [Balneolaceae bacterium]
MKHILFISAILLAITPLQARQADQIPDSPKHEFRSAWVATVPGLDWPSANHPGNEAGLRGLIQNMKLRGMNAVVLQVVPRGDAFFPSERLPWARQLTGTYGKDPGWDPLAVAIDESRRLGMEIHAWYNVFRIGDATGIEQVPGDGPQHVYLTNPEWVRTVSAAPNSLWLNAGIPDARMWAIQNVMEIVRNYDIDAIHFDFIRYEQGGYSDDFTIRDQYNPEGIVTIGDWRRWNVTEFNRVVSDSVRALKPWVKIGSTPVGHYNSSGGWAFLNGFAAVFQDSRRWLREGYNDYLAPQLYWDIGGGDAPQFDWLVRDWMGENYGRHIYVGTGPYKPNVASELPRQIDTMRVNHAHGHMHFRHAFVRGAAIYGERYNQPSLVPPMGWKDMNQPNSPELLAAVLHEDGSNTVSVSWQAPDFGRGKPEPVRFAVYRVPLSDLASTLEESIADASFLIGMTGETDFTDTPEFDAIGYEYVVTSLSRNNVESEPAVTGIATSIDDERQLAGSFRLEQNYPNPFNPTTNIRFSLDEAAHVRLAVYDLLGRVVATPVNGNHTAGVHTIGFDASHLSSGVYLYRLEAGNRQLTRKMLLIK